MVNEIRISITQLYNWLGWYTKGKNMNEHEQKKIASEIVLKARAECRKKK